MLLYWYVGPIIPWRHTYLLRQLIDSIYRTTLITTGNHQLTADGLNDILLGLTLQTRQHTLLHPLVNLRVTPHRTNQHLGGTLRERCFLPRYFLKIHQEIFGCQLHTTMLFLTQANSQVLQLPGISLWQERHKLAGRLQLRDSCYAHQKCQCLQQNQSFIHHYECYKLYNFAQR